MNKELRENIIKGDIDINNSEVYFSALAKGFIASIQSNICLNKKSIPHYILNTGDDIMYLENKGQDYSIEPQDISNESYIYTTLPRCIVDPGTINLLPDQLTSPYTRGCLEVNYNDEIVRFMAEYRRMPLTWSFDLKYHVDSYTDALKLIQVIITNLTYIRNFDIIYMGQVIPATYKMPDSHDIEKTIEIGGDYTDQKDRLIEISVDVESIIPVYDHKTVAEADVIITSTEYHLNTPGDSKIITQ